MELLCGEWNAIHDRMPGKEPTLRVTGTCCFSTAGWRCEIRRSEPQGINERMLMLDLIVTEPTGGAAEVLTEEPVEYEETTSSEYDQVSIHVRGADAEGKTLDVQEVS